MNWSEGSKGLVRGLLFSVVLLFAVSDFAVAQEKKPPAKAPSKPAAAATPSA